MVTIRECLKAASESGERLGVPLEPWSRRSVREGVCDAMTRAEDRAELRGGRADPRRGAPLRSVRRRLEVELWP